MTPSVLGTPQQVAGDPGGAWEAPHLTALVSYSRPPRTCLQSFSLATHSHFTASLTYPLLRPKHVIRGHLYVPRAVLWAVAILGLLPLRE